MHATISLLAFEHMHKVRGKVGAIIQANGVRPNEQSALPRERTSEPARVTAVDSIPKPVNPNATPDAREQLARLPRVTESEFRLACNDIAEEVAKTWSFHWRVFLEMATLGAVIIGLLGWTIHDMAKDALDKVDATDNLVLQKAESGANATLAKADTMAKDAMDKAQNHVDTLIADQFKDDKIQATISKVASDQSAELLQKHVQPSIDEFNLHLKNQQSIADRELTTFREELAKLQKRNEITELADSAIEQGDVAAFHKLRDMAQSEPPTQGSTAELFRVMNAYSIFAPVRWVGVVLHLPDPTKKQEDLTPGELLDLIKSNPQPEVRGISADLLASSGKVGSYSTAQALVDDFQKEGNLEVIKRMKKALNHVESSFQDGGTVDAQDVFDWWKAHEAEARKADSDPKPSSIPPPLVH